MEKAIYRSVYTFVIWIIYAILPYALLELIYALLNRSLKPDISTGIFAVTFFLASFQSSQAVEIYYSVGMKFWRALYLSFTEFWGLLYMQIFGRKKNIPDKFVIEEKTINDRDVT